MPCSSAQPLVFKKLNFYTKFERYYQTIPRKLCAGLPTSQTHHFPFIKIACI